ncbi:Kelch motif-containing protein [Flavobacterium flevense]|uniref:3-keto-alpha-glucoside-1,2-lyase/3-keto-2-hydroxy-glucal hydratase domain-containing protein n=1 Tax=Flavobacterium flevense TaxID=983 RepID=A0A4Y4B1M7_9FLAO|nr:family 16 glycoside hydrolase [Flavobacterium flevense]GEC72593.1 hypothetical protein FFL01_21320 [Flavobacterium flevense]SHM15382.1 Kelch motif-containing protein [Flavobacterium flevense]
MYKNILIFFLIFLKGFYSVAQSDNLSNYRWTTIDTKGKVTARHESSMVEYKEKFYLIGGRGMNPVDVFNPKTNTWEEKSKPPLEIHHFQAVIYKDAIYLIGMTGRYPNEEPLNNIWLYYPEKDKWEKGAEIPQFIKRGGAGAVVYQDKIYLVCGIDLGHTSGTNNNFNSYNLITGEWETLTKAPHIRDHFSTIVVDDNMYCIGGRNTSFHLPDNFGAFFDQTMPYIDVYNFKENKWHTMKEELPYPTAAGGLVYFQNKIIYFGGEGFLKQAYNTTQCLDLSSGKWSQLASLNTGRHSGGTVVHNNKIYVAAGSPVKGGANLNSMEVFSLDNNWISLFNGKNLEGWEVKNSEKDNGKIFWTVDNGAILYNSLKIKDNNHFWLQNKVEYGDFELRLKFKTSRENIGNSGVQVRSRFDETAKENINGTIIQGWMDGPQVDISPNEYWKTGYIYDETREYKHWINPVTIDWKLTKKDVEPKKTSNYFEDEGLGWNDLTIICKGMNIKTVVNNVIVSDYDGSGVLDDKEHKKHRVGQTGFIALQGHMNSENKIWFKDIEIRELKK